MLRSRKSIGKIRVIIGIVLFAATVDALRMSGQHAKQHDDGSKIVQTIRLSGHQQPEHTIHINEGNEMEPTQNGNDNEDRRDDHSRNNDLSRPLVNDIRNEQTGLNFPHNSHHGNTGRYQDTREAYSSQQNNRASVPGRPWGRNRPNRRFRQRQFSGTNSNGIVSRYHGRSQAAHKGPVGYVRNDLLDRGSETDRVRMGSNHSSRTLDVSDGRRESRLRVVASLQAARQRKGEQVHQYRLPNGNSLSHRCSHRINTDNANTVTVLESRHRTDTEAGGSEHTESSFQRVTYVQCDSIDENALLLFNNEMNRSDVVIMRGGESRLPAGARSERRRKPSISRYDTFDSDINSRGHGLELVPDYRLRIGESSIFDRAEAPSLHRVAVSTANGYPNQISESSVSTGRHSSNPQHVGSWNHNRSNTVKTPTNIDWNRGDAYGRLRGYPEQLYMTEVDEPAYHISRHRSTIKMKQLRFNRNRHTHPNIIRLHQRSNRPSNVASL